MSFYRETVKKSFTHTCICLICASALPLSAVHDFPRPEQSLLRPSSLERRKNFCLLPDNISPQIQIYPTLTEVMTSTSVSSSYMDRVFRRYIS